MRCRAVALLLAVGTPGCRDVLGIDPLPPITLINLVDSGQPRDATAADSSTPSEAAAADAGDAGPHFCASAPDASTICDDFDEGQPIEHGWDNTKGGTPDLGLAGGGMISADSALYYSSPRSVSLSLLALNAGDVASAFLIKYLSFTPSALTIEAEIQVKTEKYEPGGRSVLLYASFLPGGSVNIERDSTGTSLWLATGGASPVVTKIPFTQSDLIVGAWSLLAIAIQNQPTDGGLSGQIAVLLDGLPVVNAALPATFQVTNTQEIDVGPLASGPMEASQVNFDNVLIVAN